MDANKVSFLDPDKSTDRGCWHQYRRRVLIVPGTSARIVGINRYKAHFLNDCSNMYSLK